MLGSDRHLTSLLWHFYNHKNLPYSWWCRCSVDERWFYLAVFLLWAKFSPTQPYTAMGTIFQGEHIRPHPKWTATTCSSHFWEKLISCPRLWEGTLPLQTSRVTGVNPPTRGRFTAVDKNHLSALCWLSPNRPDRAALGQSHHSKKSLIELKMNRQDTSQ